MSPDVMTWEEETPSKNLLKGLALITVYISHVGMQTVQAEQTAKNIAEINRKSAVTVRGV